MFCIVLVYNCLYVNAGPAHMVEEEEAPHQSPPTAAIISDRRIVTDRTDLLLAASVYRRLVTVLYSTCYSSICIYLEDSCFTMLIQHL